MDHTVHIKGGFESALKGQYNLGSLTVTDHQFLSFFTISHIFLSANLFLQPSGFIPHMKTFIFPHGPHTVHIKGGFEYALKGQYNLGMHFR
jgi:hypothetical protein